MARWDLWCRPKYFKETNDEFNLKNIPRNSSLDKSEEDIDGITKPFFYISKPDTTFI